MFTTQTLQACDLQSASQLDQKWFGEFGISVDQLEKYIVDNPKGSLSLFCDGNFEGFATFEILKQRKPNDYIGNIPIVSKVLFIQQFTTTTNYSKKDMKMDQELVNTIEIKAKELHCDEIWEALAIKHPYCEKMNKKHDAFGFYMMNGFVFDDTNILTWKPDKTISIPCYLLRKKIIND